jgi:demethylmenaquinone methyltransferase/2-methoxy-6-polyprenyl-1,4-benzoquinol methylase
MSEYKNIARFYDPLLYPALQPVRNKVASELKNLKAQKIVDLCCGTGNQLKLLRKKGFEKLYGVDLSAEMLAVAAKGIDINCKLEDASATAFAAGEFDVVIISFALHEKPFEIAAAIVREAHRIVRVGGKIMVADYAFDSKAKSIGKFGVSFVEKNAGDEHYSNFMAFNNYGGLEKLFDSQKIAKEYRFHFGATVLRVYNT